MPIDATKWITSQPNIQHIYHPGGTRENANVVVLGLNIGMKF
jgi:carbohydrate-selective porin OprB